MSDIQKQHGKKVLGCRDRDRAGFMVGMNG